MNALVIQCKWRLDEYSTGYTLTHSTAVEFLALLFSRMGYEHISRNDTDKCFENQSEERIPTKKYNVQGDINEMQVRYKFLKSSYAKMGAVIYA